MSARQARAARVRKAVAQWERYQSARIRASFALPEIWRRVGAKIAAAFAMQPPLHLFTRASDADSRGIVFNVDRA